MNDLISAANVSDDPSSDQWREVLSAVVFNGKPGELACLDELGNRLMTAGLVSAAHAWCVTSTYEVRLLIPHQFSPLAIFAVRGCDTRRFRPDDHSHPEPA